MKKLIDYGWVLLLLVVGGVLLTLVRPVDGEAGVEAAVVEIGQVPETSFGQSISGTERLESAVKALGLRLDEMEKNAGGRYQFVVVKERLLRLDAHTGQIAFFNYVSEAYFDTLKIEEREIGPQSSFYRDYISFLRGIGQP